MELGNQIKRHRKNMGISQAELAEKIYVSSQTISNWENERSYPDIQNLIALSVMFNVSLDELVKGDVKEMKHVIDQEKMNRYSILMLVFMLLPLILLGPAVNYFGVYGVVVLSIVYLIGFYYAHRVDKIKKKYNVKTYKEIVDFMERGEINHQSRDKVKYYSETIFIVSIFALIGALIALGSLWIFDI